MFNLLLYDADVLYEVCFPYSSSVEKMSLQKFYDRENLMLHCYLKYV